MITPSTSILKNNSDPIPRYYFGFQLIAKKLVDQLSKDIENIQHGKPHEYEIKSINQAKSAASEIQNLLGESEDTFVHRNHIDTALALYNQARPKSSKINNCDNYKTYVNNIAMYQLKWIMTLLDPNKFQNNKHYTFRKKIHQFFCGKAQHYQSIFAFRVDNNIYTSKCMNRHYANNTSQAA